MKLISDGVPASTRATRAIVDLGRVAGNVRVFRGLVGPDVKLMAVVKANAYGHGAVMVAKTATGAGADYLGVATVDEGVQLRQSGLAAPILVLGPVSDDEIPTAIRSKLELAVGSFESVSRFATVSCSIQVPMRIHLKIDTGMRRFGGKPEEVPSIATRIASSPNLHLVGTFTHFAAADERDESPTVNQAARFEEALGLLRAEGLNPGIRHAANSAATLRSRRYDFDMVRVGISLYGISPSAEIPLTMGIRPALTIQSRIGRVLNLDRGDRVSYGGTYTATRRERAALIPIGYADGYRRALSNRGWVGIQGHRCPVLGRVCMDQLVVGLPDDVDVKEGDLVTLVGDSDLGAPSLNDLAKMTETIAYEIATGITRRVPRFYVDGGEVIAIEDLHEVREIT